MKKRILSIGLAAMLLTGEEPVKPETVSGDLNGDGLVNLKDVVLLRRYIAGGWNVTL